MQQVCVSDKGDDKNDGLSLEAPIKSWIVFVACLGPAPYSFHQEQQDPTQNPRQPYRNKCQLSPTAPVGNGKSLPQFSTPPFFA